MCPVCNGLVPLSLKVQNPRTYCSARCRKTAYRRRQKGLDAKLSVDFSFSKTLPTDVPYPTTVEIRQNRIRGSTPSSKIGVVQRRFKGRH